MALSEKLEILIEAVGGESVVRAFNRVGAAADDTGQAAGDAGAETGSAFEKLSEKLGVSGGTIKAGLAAAATAAVGFGFAAVGAFMDATQEVLEFQRASGTTAETASQIVAALDDMGIAAETGGKAFFTLAKNVEGNAEKLAGLGISAARSADGNVDLAETLLNVADAYNATSDQGQRAALLSASFGKAGKDLIPILEQGRVGIQELYAGAEAAGNIFSQDDVNQGEALRIAIDGLKDSAGSFAMEVGSKLIPVITGGITVLTNMIGVARTLGGVIGNVTDFLGDLNPGFEIFGHHVGLLDVGLTVATAGVYGVAKGVYEVGTSLADMGNEAADAVAANEAMTASFKAETAAAAELEAEIKSLQSELFASVSATRAVETARRSLDEATRRQSEAQKDLNKLLATHGVDLKAVKAATTGVADANRALEQSHKDVAGAVRDVADANKTLEKANQDVADAQAEVGRVTRELNDLFSGKAAAEAGADAQDDVTAAQIRLRRAQNSSVRAQEQFNEIQADGTATGLDLSEAQLDVEQAALDLKDAEEGVVAATEALNEAWRIGAENSGEVIDKRSDLKGLNETLKAAEEGVAAATQGVIDKQDMLKSAQQGVIDSTQSLVEKQLALKAAQAGDPEFQDRVADARRGVRDATQGIADATYDLSAKTYDASEKAAAFNKSLGESTIAGEALRKKFVDEMANNPAFNGFLSGPLSQLNLMQQAARELESTIGSHLAARFLGPGPPKGLPPSVNSRVGAIPGSPADYLLNGGVTINVAGSVVSEQNLLDVVIKGLIERSKRGGTLQVGYN